MTLEELLAIEPKPLVIGELNTETRYVIVFDEHAVARTFVEQVQRSLQELGIKSISLRLHPSVLPKIFEVKPRSLRRCSRRDRRPSATTGWWRLCMSRIGLGAIRAGRSWGSMSPSSLLRNWRRRQKLMQRDELAALGHEPTSLAEMES